MKSTRWTLSFVLIALAISLHSHLQAAPLGTAFTYQGRLMDGGNAANGVYELRLGLFNDFAVGDQMGNLVTNRNIAVSNGLFTTAVDFGAGIFDGTASWLEMGVRTNGSLADFGTLSPRQSLTPSPYALYATKAGAAAVAALADAVVPNSVTGDGIQNSTLTAAKIANGQVVKTLNGLTDNVTLSAGTGLTLSGTTFSIAFGGTGIAATAAHSDHSHDAAYAPLVHTHSAADITSGTLSEARLSANVARLSANQTFVGSNIFSGVVCLTNTANKLAGSFSGDGVGLTNLPSLWRIAGNSGTTPGPNFLGTTDNQPLELKVNGSRALRLEPTASDGNRSGIVNMIGGSPANFVGPGVYGAVIAGGGAANYFGTSSNAVLADFGFVGGGYQNVILDNAISSIVGGGYQNTIGAFAYDSTIGGGGVNTIQHDAFDSTIAGGHFNAILSLASGSSIGGGYFNTVQSSAYDSSIGGGAYNTIQANAQFATILGGNLNSVTGSYGLAAGRRAQANHQGAFVWGDSTDADIASTGNDQFVLRASGGFYVYGASGTQLLSLDPAGRLTTLGCISSAGNSNLEFKLSGLRALGLETTVTDTFHSNIVNVIAGSSVNYVAAGIYGATIAGGGALNYRGTADTNSVSADFGTIGGGLHNTVQPGASASTISGGRVNTIQTNTKDSIIGGGFDNTIQSEGTGSIIGGGQNNTIQLGAVWSTIGGGLANQIGDSFAVVPGGDSNVAAGRNSFAAGHRAYAHTGAFVWGDSTEANIASTGPDQFVIRARGGVQLDGPSLTSLSFGNNVRQMINLWGTSYGIGVQAYTTYFRCDGSSPNANGFAWYQGGSHSDAQADAGPGGVVLMQLLNGGLYVHGTFVSASDRNQKEHFEGVDARDLLAKVVALPITTWNYKQDTGTRHLGPMAQDFYAAFKVGPDDKHIATVDESGVALAAIQGLHEVVKEKETRIAALEKRLAELEKQNKERDARLARLEKAVASGLGEFQQAADQRGGDQ